MLPEERLKWIPKFPSFLTDKSGISNAIRNKARQKHGIFSGNWPSICWKSASVNKERVFCDCLRQFSGHFRIGCKIYWGEANEILFPNEYKSIVLFIFCLLYPLYLCMFTSLVCSNHQLRPSVSCSIPFTFPRIVFVCKVKNSTKFGFYEL